MTATPEASREAIMKRIRGLLAKAESTDQPPEAEALTERAVKLMAKYGVDAAPLGPADGTTPQVSHRIVEFPNPYGIDKLCLYSAIADAFRCQMVQLPRTRGARRLHVFATPADMELVELLHASLEIQSANALNAAMRETGRADKGFKKGFLSGFAVTIQRRLKAAEANARQDAEREGASAALVLADRSALVQKAADEAYPNVRRNRARKVGMDAYRLGVDAGQRADIGGARLGSDQRPAIG